MWSSIIIFSQYSANANGLMVVMDFDRWNELVYFKYSKKMPVIYCTFLIGNHQGLINGLSTYLPYIMSDVSLFFHFFICSFCSCQ